MKSLFEKHSSSASPLCYLSQSYQLQVYCWVSVVLSNPNTVKAYPFLDITLLQNILH